MITYSLKHYLTSVIALAMLIGGLSIPGSVYASKKVALVIGNNYYMNVPNLTKAGSDASTIARVLSKTGFEVIESHDASRRETNLKLQEFIARVEPGDVAMFYYAGHGVEILGQNYLLPVDVPPAEPGQEGFVRSESIGLVSILDRLREKQARLNIVVLDACRNNPFKNSYQRSVGSTRGLAPVTPPKGTFILYSADTGEAALDALSEKDTNPNSVFTRVLAPLILQPDIHLASLARSVRRQVKALANSVQHQQTPAYYDAVLGDFYFMSTSSSESSVINSSVSKARVESVPAGNQSGALELAFWREVKNSKNKAFLESYIKQYPDGRFVHLARAKIEALDAPSRPPRIVVKQKQTAVEIAPEKDVIEIAKKQEIADREAVHTIARESEQLALCEQHLLEKRLTTGAGGNAYECYQKVLKESPDSQGAIAGLRQVEDKYASWARYYIGDNKWLRAKTNLDKLASINPDHPAIEELSSALVNQRAQAAVDLAGSGEKVKPAKAANINTQTTDEAADTQLVPQSKSIFLQ